MKKYHVAAGDGKEYYGVGYESYRQAESLLKISQKYDPQAHIVEEEYHSTKADRIRAMSDEELAEFICSRCHFQELDNTMCGAIISCDGNCLEWLKQPMEGECE